MSISQKTTTQFTNLQSDMIYVYEQQDPEIINILTQSNKQFEVAFNTIIQNNKLGILGIDEKPAISEDGSNTLAEYQTIIDYQGKEMINPVTNLPILVNESETTDSRCPFWTLGQYNITNKEQWINKTKKCIQARNLNFKLINFLFACNKRIQELTKENILQQFKIGKTVQSRQTLEQWLSHRVQCMINGQKYFVKCIKQYQLGISYKAYKEYQDEQYNYTTQENEIHRPKLAMLINIETIGQDTDQIKYGKLVDPILIICQFIQFIISMFNTAPTDNITYKIQTATIIAFDFDNILDFTIIEQITNHIDVINEEIKEQTLQQIINHMYAIAVLLKLDTQYKQNVQLDINNVPQEYKYEQDNRNFKQIYNSYPFLFRPRDKYTHQLIVDEFDISIINVEVDQEYYIPLIIQEESVSVTPNKLDKWGNLIFNQYGKLIPDENKKYQEIQRRICLNIEEVQFKEQQIIELNEKSQDKNKFSELYNYIVETEECKKAKNEIQNKTGSTVYDKIYNQSIRKYVQENLKELNKNLGDLNVIFINKFMKQVYGYNIQKKLRENPQSYKILELRENIKEIENPGLQLDILSDSAKQLKKSMVRQSKKLYQECIHCKVYCYKCYPTRTDIQYKLIINE